MSTSSNARAHTERHASIDELDRSIVTLAVQMNRITHDFLVLVRRFDERAGWLKWSFENCADWLHYRCDISKSAAREKVRVAHAIKTLPVIAAAFAEGRLSYSKVRALTRVAKRENEQELLTYALKNTAARVEERCRELRCGTAASTDDAVRAHARRTLWLRRDEARGMVTITVELPIETGELVDKALEKAMQAEMPSGPEFKDESWCAQRADALVAMAKDYLSGNREGSPGTPDHYQVTIHVDEAALRGSAGSRSGLPIETVRRITCDSDLIALVEGKDGTPLSVGRKTRLATAAVRRALWARDNSCCQFPGCGCKRYLHIHHIVHWSLDGETNLPNLILLCARHHRLLHEGGFTIEKDYRDRWIFRRPDGRVVPACGYRPEDVLDIESADEYVNRRASAEVLRAPAEASHISAEVARACAEAARSFVEESKVKEPSAEAWKVKEPSTSYRSTPVMRTRFRGSVRASAATAIRMPRYANATWPWRRQPLWPAMQGRQTVIPHDPLAATCVKRSGGDRAS